MYYRRRIPNACHSRAGRKLPLSFSEPAVVGTRDRQGWQNPVQWGLDPNRSRMVSRLTRSSIRHRCFWYSKTEILYGAFRYSFGIESDFKMVLAIISDLDSHTGLHLFHENVPSSRFRVLSLICLPFGQSLRYLPAVQPNPRGKRSLCPA
jgi:hypothetical protein